MCSEVGGVHISCQCKSEQYVKGELTFMKKTWIIYTCTDKEVEEYTLNCYQRLPPEGRVWKKIFTLF